MNEPMVVREAGSGPQCMEVHHFCFSCGAIVCGTDALDQHERLGHELARSFAPRSAGARRRICGLDVAERPAA